MNEKDLKYTTTHEWVSLNGDTATIGISNHAQKELGDIVFIELPEVGKAVKKAEAFGTIESTKAASQIYSPVSGKIIEINTTLAAQPESVNKEPYGKGWLIKVKVSAKDEVAALLDFTQYSQTLH
jgi:glycine cleavage system H protein